MKYDIILPNVPTPLSCKRIIDVEKVEHNLQNGKVTFHDANGSVIAVAPSTALIIKID